MGDKIPVGYRFYPTEEELIFYLHQKFEGANLDRLIPVLYIYDYDPSELPELSGEPCRRDTQLREWYFFIPRQEREARGGRTNRLTTSGYWKATGSPGSVYSSDDRIIGVKRTMVFYKGRASGDKSGTSAAGIKTDWKMNEYRALDHHGKPRLELSVCRVYTESKCVRSFDRKPSSRVSTGRSPALEVPFNDHQPVPLNSDARAMGRTCSDDQSSCSGETGGGDAHQSNPGDDLLGMEIDNLPLWEWEELNGFWN
ncbi:hypothetical protein Nepgr_011805 [Nepenthes gracilis]|uniref:NAC domain-containing protein n=1 Tax=Nepenthes gracilis TaxID=150966 RepID=A0AAD3SFZ0_NEPGR|nr:hypothetical protein Nepgr_011805 [Nepenthes gracilis]